MRRSRCSDAPQLVLHVNSAADVSLDDDVVFDALFELACLWLMDPGGRATTEWSEAMDRAVDLLDRVPSPVIAEAAARVGKVWAIGASALHPERAERVLPVVASMLLEEARRSIADSSRAHLTLV